MKDLIDRVSTAVSDTKESFGAHLERLVNLPESVRDKAVQHLNQVLEAIPLVESAGYVAHQVSFNIGLSPSATIRFQKTNAGNLKETLERVRERPIAYAILKALDSADQLQAHLKLGRFQFDTIDINVGLTPSVTIQLNPKAGQA